RHVRRYTHIKKQVGAVGGAAHAPGVSCLNATQVRYSPMTAIGSFLLPFGAPLHNCLQHVIHATNRSLLLASFAESGVHVHTFGGEAHPERPVVFEHKLHVGGFAKNAHVGQHAVVHQVMRSHPVASVLLACIFAPLGFLNLADNCGQHHVTFEPHAGTL